LFGTVAHQLAQCEPLKTAEKLGENDAIPVEGSEYVVQFNFPKSSDPFIQ
jgi:hypothetical protein